MDWYQTVFEVIDMRSFSNLWYWIGLAVLWSSASHWVLGVPNDLIARAKRKGGPAQQDLIDLVRINCNRILYIQRTAGLWVLAFTCAVIAALCMLGFWYKVEFAQALFLFVFPLSIVGALSIWTANRIHNDETSELLYRRLGVHRFLTQLIGMISVFVTSMWGMFQNMTIGVLG